MVVLMASLYFVDFANAQSRTVHASRRLITQPIDESRFVTLAGNTLPEANATSDRGSVPDSLPLENMQLQLRLPAEKEQELEHLNHELVDPASPNFHRWLTPERFKQEFSLAPEDIEAITTWLRSMGFTINVVYPRSIAFSGTAGEVRKAFRTEIHYVEVKGVKHVANMSDPQIPAALAPAVAGITSLNDFMPHPMSATH